MKSTVAGIGGILFIVANLLGVALHLWTVLLAFKGYGFILAAGALASPVLSQVLMFGTVTFKFGLMNEYSLSCLACLGVYALAFGLLSRAA